MDRDNQPPGAASYSLELSEQEVLRYRLMAARPAPTRSPSPTAWRSPHPGKPAATSNGTKPPAMQPAT